MERKNIVLCLIGYVLVCGMHSSGILIVGLALVAWLTYKVASKFVNVLLIFAIGGISALLTFLSGITDNSFIQVVAGKTELSVQRMDFNFETNYLVNVATYAVGIIIMFYAFTYIRKYIDNIGEKRFFRFVEVIFVFMIGSIVNGLIFVRMARWILPVVTAIVFMVGMQIQKNRYNQGLINTSYFSDTPRSEKIRFSNKGITSFFFFAYSVVHLWYDCNGSSLIWLHFN